MSDYLQDSFIPFHTIGAQELDELEGEFSAIVAEAESTTTDDKPLTLTYTLRYDGMGIVRQGFEEVKNCFGRARRVERIVFDVSGPKNVLRGKGKRIQLILDAMDSSRCYMSVTDDDEKWVDNVFKRLSARLSQYRNYNGVLRHPLVELLIQLFGVTSAFSLCLILASVLSPALKIQHSFFVLFIGFFLIFSNLWTYILVLLGKIRDKFWPIISFKKRPLGIIGQAVVGLVITGILSLLVKWSWRILLSVSSQVIQ